VESRTIRKISIKEKQIEFWLNLFLCFLDKVFANRPTLLTALWLLPVGGGKFVGGSGCDHPYLGCLKNTQNHIHFSNFFIIFGCVVLCNACFLNLLEFLQ